MNYLRKIGMRNIKTALAAFICVLISRYVFKMRFPFYAAIASVICMQSSVIDSFHAGKNRMIGTFVGAVTGLCFSLAFPSTIWLCGLGIFIVISICNILKCQKSVTIGCIVFLAITTHISEAPPFEYSFNRLLDTFIGILVCVFINYFLIPPEYFDDIHKDSNKIVDDIFLIFGNVLYLNDQTELSKLNKQISSLENLLNSHMKEFKGKRHKHVNTKIIISLIANAKEAYNHLYIIYNLNKNCVLNDENHYKLKKVYNHNYERKEYTHTELNIIYNYHIKELIQIIDDLRKLDLSRKSLEVNYRHLSNISNKNK